jgi:hypothetical protein
VVKFNDENIESIQQITLGQSKSAVVAVAVIDGMLLVAYEQTLCFGSLAKLKDQRNAASDLRSKNINDIGYPCGKMRIVSLCEFAQVENKTPLPDKCILTCECEEGMLHFFIISKCQENLRIEARV